MVVAKAGWGGNEIGFIFIAPHSPSYIASYKCGGSMCVCIVHANESPRVVESEIGACLLHLKPGRRERKEKKYFLFPPPPPTTHTCLSPSLCREKGRERSQKGFDK